MTTERNLLIFSTILYLIGMALAIPARNRVDWGNYAVFVPTGLVALAWANSFLRSKILAWAVFSLGFVLALAVFGPLVVGVRIQTGEGWIQLLRAFLSFAGVAGAGALQLRPARREREGGR
jgi:hypothetical protein